MSSIAVVRISCRKNLGIQPILEPIKSIQNTDIGLVTYANSITLTPGTVTLSIEGNNLLVHALDLQFMNDLQEGEMDRRVKQIIK
jgi:multicomponent Na+:H+ antiporter subunit E